MVNLDKFYVNPTLLMCVGNADRVYKLFKLDGEGETLSIFPDLCISLKDQGQ